MSDIENSNRVCHSDWTFFDFHDCSDETICEMVQWLYDNVAKEYFHIKIENSSYASAGHIGFNETKAAAAFKLRWL